MGESSHHKYLLWSETCKLISHTHTKNNLSYMYITHSYGSCKILGSLFKLEAGLSDVCWPGGS